MKNLLFFSLAFAAVSMLGINANAQDVTTSYGTVSGADDANQAGPMWGMSMTPDEGASPGGPHGTLFLTEMQFQASSSTLGPIGQVFLQVYDSFSTDGSGAITGIGNQIAVSTNSLEMASVGLEGTATWSFDGTTGLTAADEYMFVTALDTNVATLADHTNLGNGGQWELTTGDGYAGGQAFRQNGGESDWDMEFNASFSTVAVPEPATLAIFGFSAFGLATRRRRRC